MDIHRRLFLGGAIAAPLLLTGTGCNTSPAPQGTTDATKFVIRGARTVVTMDPELGELTEADIVVEDGTIRAVGTDLDAPPGAEEVDASALVALPGFVDTHWHMWNSIARGFGNSSAGGFGPTMGRLSPLFEPEDSAAGVRLALAEAVDSGITTVNNWAHNVRSPEHADAEIEALLSSGVRGRFSYGYPQTATPETLMDLDHLRDTASGWDSELVDLGICARGPDRSEEAVWRQEWRAARDLGLPITTHASSTPAEVSRGGIAALAAGGGLGPDVQLVHLTAASPDDISQIAEAGCAVSLSPWTELRVGYGFPPIVPLRDADARVGLSVDNTVLAGQADMFSVMRLTSDLAAGVGREQLSLPEETALKWATSGAAESLGLASKTGTLTPGKHADIVLLRADTVSTAPVRDATALLVRAGRPSDVDFVMIDGVVHKRDGRLVRVEVEELIDDARSRIDRLRRDADV